MNPPTRNSALKTSSIVESSVIGSTLWNFCADGMYVVELASHSEDPAQRVEFRVVAVNPAGSAPDALTAQVIERYNKRYAQCLQTMKPVSFEEAQQKQDKTQYWRLTAYPLGATPEDTRQLLVTATNITNYKQPSLHLASQTATQKVLQQVI
ncbi:MAG: hypothetical protein AAFU53_09260, partial [Cyanobacteria bacterium J06632_3]